MLFHCSPLLVIQILLRKKLQIVFNTFKKIGNNTNVCVNEILFNPFISVPLVKVLKNSKIQMEHSRLIVEPNGTVYIYNYFYFYFLFLNGQFLTTIFFDLLEIYPNLTYYAKTLNSSTCFQIFKEQDHKL
jgi:hypothetical protein